MFSVYLAILIFFVYIFIYELKNKFPMDSFNIFILGITTSILLLLQLTIFDMVISCNSKSKTIKEQMVIYPNKNGNFIVIDKSNNDANNIKYFYKKHKNTNYKTFSVNRFKITESDTTKRGYILTKQHIITSFMRKFTLGGIFISHEIIIPRGKKQYLKN